MLKYLIFHSRVFTTFIFLLIASVLGHLIYFSSIVNIFDCLNNTPHTCTINLLCLIHLDPALKLDLDNQETKIGGRILGLRDVTLDDNFTLLEQDAIAFQGSHTNTCHFWGDVLMYFHFISMLEAILRADLDLSTLYHEYFTFLGVFED